MWNLATSEDIQADSVQSLFSCKNVLRLTLFCKLVSYKTMENNNKNKKKQQAFCDQADGFVTFIIETKMQS